MGDRSAHDERGGSRPLARTRLRRPRRWMLGTEVKWILCPRRVGGGRAGQTECSFSLLCVLFLFPLFGGHGGKGIGEPWCDSHVVGDRIWFKGGKMVAAVREGSGIANKRLHTRVVRIQSSHKRLVPKAPRPASQLYTLLEPVSHDTT